MVINIEAKADEAFGDVIGEYLDRKRGSRSKVPERIRQLSMALFAREPDEAIRRLRYQLLHATAATLIEAKNRKTELALLLVHEFRSANLDRDKLAQNGADWDNFVRSFPKLGAARCAENQIVGPVSVPGNGRVPEDVPLYLGKLVTDLR